MTIAQRFDRSQRYKKVTDWDTYRVGDKVKYPVGAGFKVATFVGSEFDRVAQVRYLRLARDDGKIIRADYLKCHVFVEPRPVEVKPIKLYAYRCRRSRAS